MDKKDVRLRVSLLVSRADQRQKEALDFLKLQSREYVFTLTRSIQDGCKSREPEKRILSMLAEIGLYALLAGEVDGVLAEQDI